MMEENRAVSLCMVLQGSHDGTTSTDWLPPTSLVLQTLMRAPEHHLMGPSDKAVKSISAPICRWNTEACTGWGISSGCWAASHMAGCGWVGWGWTQSFPQKRVKSCWEDRTWAHWNRASHTGLWLEESSGQSGQIVTLFLSTCRELVPGPHRPQNP